MAQPTQNPNETTIFERRRHWINVAPILIACFILMLVLLLAISLYGTHSASVNSLVPAAVIASIAAIYIMIVALIALLSLWIYSQNRLILTNHHLVEYTRRGLFDHSIAQFSLIKLQDVSAEQSGILANLLGYGSIRIETAGEEEEFNFRQVPHPQALADDIMKAHEALADGSSVAKDI